MFRLLPKAPALTTPRRSTMSTNSQSENADTVEIRDKEDAVRVADLLHDSVSKKCVVKGGIAGEVKTAWLHQTKAIREYLASLPNTPSPAPSSPGSFFSASSSIQPTTEELYSATLDALRNVTAELALLRTETTSELNSLKGEIAALRSTPHLCQASQTSVKSLNTSPASSDNGLTTRIERVATYSNVTANSTKEKPKMRPPRPEPRVTSTVRIKATDAKDLCSALKDIPLPRNISLTNSRQLKDGSRLIYCDKPDELKELFTGSESIEVVKPPSFKPRIKVLNVSKSILTEEVKVALNVPDCRLLCTTKAKDPSLCHYTFEVPPDDLGNLLKKRVWLSDWTACRIVECHDAPQCVMCLRPGHRSDHCNHQIDGALCARCGVAGHLAKDCQAPKPCCANCRRSKREDREHSAFSKSCPELKRYVKWRQSYTQSNV